MLLLAIFIAGAIAVCVPLIAVILVSVASRQEDTAWSLGGPARGAGHAVARRILGFHRPLRPSGITRPRPPAIRPRPPAARPRPPAARPGTPAARPGTPAGAGCR